MKTQNRKYQYLILAGFLMMIGCRGSVEADFQVDKKEAIVSEGITFTNQSENATSYRWEMGDGTTINVSKPYHRTFTYAYDTTGTYEVTLIASNGSGQDKATQVIEIPYAKYLVSIRLNKAPPSDDPSDNADYSFELESGYDTAYTQVYRDIEAQNYPLRYQDSMGTVILTDQEWTVKLIENGFTSDEVVSEWTFNGLDKEGQNAIFTLTDNPRDTFEVEADFCYNYR